MHERFPEPESRTDDRSVPLGSLTESLKRSNAVSNLNRKLLNSVYNAQESREAVLGGARIVDCEDPRSALGNIKPREIMDIADAVLDFHRDLDVQLSTNIG